MKVPEKTFYYTDENNDEFSGVEREKFEIDGGWKYLFTSLPARLLEAFIYRIIMTPIAFLYCKLRFGLRVHGKEKLKEHKKGIYLYGNHTQIPGDGFFPTVIAFPKKVRVVVNSENVALGGTRFFMKSVGALPVPTKISGTKNFLSAVAKSASDGCVAVYPEAHIWPYYTGVRNFPPSAFTFPAKDALPVYTFSVRYRKRAFSLPGVDIDIDGPFVPEGGTEREKRVFLARTAKEAVRARVCVPENHKFANYVKKD